MFLLRTISLVFALLAQSAVAANSTDRIPAIAFAQLPNIEHPALTPDGKAIAFLRPVEGKQHLTMQQIGSPETLRIFSVGEEMDFAWLNWASDTILVFALKFFAKRNHFVETTETRLMSVARDGTDMQHIIKPDEVDVLGSRASKRKLAPPQLQDQVVSWLPDEPKYILVAVDGDHNGMTEVRKVNVGNGDYSLAVGNVSGIQSWNSDPAGVVRFGWGHERGERHTVYRNKKGGFDRSDRHQWLDDEWLPVAFSDEVNMIFVSGYAGTGTREIRRLNVVDGAFADTVYADPVYSHAGMIVDRYGRPVGVRYIDDFLRSSYFDDELDRLQRSIDKALPDTINEFVSMSDDRKRIVVYAANDVDPGVYMLWDRDRKTIDSIGERMPGLDPARMSPTRPVSFAAADNLTIPAYLTLPRGGSEKNLPGIVLPHGGPESRSDSRFWFLAQFLASRGYAVLQPNFRGSSGYTRAFRDAGIREWGGLMQDDVTAGAEWLVAEGIADPERMCIVGWSYGGYSAAMGAIKTPELFRCAASINGVLDLVQLARDDLQYIGGSYWIKEIGLEGERLKAVSPFHHAEAIEVPLLIVQARDDSRVHLDQATGIAGKLDKMGKPVELVIVDRGGHSITDPESRLTMLQALERFLENYL